MMLHLHSAAYDEALEAAAWYDNREDGIGQEFLDAVGQAIDPVRGNP